MAALALAFDILAKDNASKTFDKVSRSADRTGKSGTNMGRTMGAGLKLAAGALIGLGAAAVVGFGSFIKDAAESAKIGRMTEAVIKSTGGSAKITAAQVGDLATAISNKTGADDEAIQSASNMLLTFTNVRNEVGKGNDIFNQATQTVTDMSAALGTDMKASSVQLGKALNDPIKGISALSKVGVSFTQQQKDQIKTLVKSGDTLGAQKVILKELGKEFGGAAAAASDPLTRLKVIAGNLSEQIGGALLPAVNQFASFLGDYVIPKVSKLVDTMGPGLGRASKLVAEGLRTAYLGVRAFFLALRDGDVTSDGFIGFMETIGDFLHRMVVPGLKNAGGAFAGLWESVKSLWPALKQVAQQLYETYSSLGVSTWALFKVALQQLPAVLDSLTVGLKDTSAWIKDNKTLVGALVTAVTAGVAIFKVYKVTMAIVSAATKAYAVIQGVLNVVLTANPIGVVIVLVAALAAGLVYAYKNSETFRSYVTTAFSMVKIGALTLAKVAVGAFKFMVGVWFTVVGGILNGAAKAFGWIPGIGPKLQGVATEFGKFKDSANAKLEAIQNDIDVNIKTEKAALALEKLHREYISKGWTVTATARINMTYSGNGMQSGSGGGSDSNPPRGGGASGGLLRPVRAAAGHAWGRYASGGLHRAIDFPTAVGTPLRAPMSGRVLSTIFQPGGFGVNIRTADADGNYSIFGHLSRLLVSAGQSFNRGQIIGLTGSTGRSSGPHLHYERRHIAYDPNTSFNFTNALGRNKGGPVWPGGAFAVGDNKDGSWNKTTELFVPKQSGRIYTQDQIAAGGGGVTSSGGRMHPDDLAQLKAALRSGAREGTAAGFGYQVLEAARGGR